MPRIAVIGTEQESSTLIAAVERLPHVDCDGVAADSPLDNYDAVAACSVPAGGQQLLLNAAHNGRHLLVDLTVFSSLDDANKVIAACREANVRLMIALPLRFLPSVQAIRGSLDAGQLGAPGVLRIHRWADQPGDDINQLLVREVDLANWFFGQLPDSIYAIARGAEAAREFLQLQLGFADGGSALIDVTNALPAGDDYYSLSIIAADGSAYANDHHDAQLLFGGGPATTQTTRPGIRHWADLIRDFTAAIDESRDPSIGSETAIDALRVMAAIEQSIRSGNALCRQGDEYEPA